MPRTQAGDPLTERTIRVLDAVLDDFGGRRFAVRDWTGRRHDPPGPAEFELILTGPGSLRAMFFPLNDRTFGEAYVTRAIDVEGDLVAAMRVAYTIIETRVPAAVRARQLRLLLTLPRAGTGRPRELRARRGGRAHSVARDRRVNDFHYSRSNDFYRLWLDEWMAYTCGYFRTDADSLDAAQVQKFDLVCRKLRLREGDRLLDVGCGWGGLAIHAARHYGAVVHAVTNSTAQAELAAERVAAAGLAGRCRIELTDFRALDDTRRYDHVSSVGLVEHLGPAVWRTYLAKVWRLLEPGGTLLNHGMTGKAGEPVGSPFLDAYVFPDARLMTIGATVRAAEDAGFEILDVENLRRHYARTIRAWRERLDAAEAEAVALVGDRTVRVYRIYFAGLEHAYRRGRINLHQTLLQKSPAGRTDLPMSREDWYAPPQR
ncbi:class I SAM-dependent methyltransferase [Dactylosporangium vinaceum]|uniref:Class I SAM-dependent methyltransferase n=1 Tax=Dactylosporangium vinaceum TaxID=53362 RepID=A0ABV5MR62_9ACTN|nr:cyclopropane-fatty-acyl-phospholipid synthase family protein [Dactylosporangium vinaceum]UAC00560.1 class I SAM-dependent methyltransferase [Dactylosporangium vinaceum]